MRVRWPAGHPNFTVAAATGVCYQTRPMSYVIVAIIAAAAGFVGGILFSRRNKAITDKVGNVIDAAKK